MTSQIHTLPSYQQVTAANQVDNKKTLSDRDNVVVQAPNQLPWENTAKSDINHNDASNIIWVPAAKHPQIAPNEFLEWIKTHGGTTPYNKNPVRRQRSTLSATYISSEEEDDDDDDDDDHNDGDNDNHINLAMDDDDLPASSVNPIDPIDTITTNDTNLPDETYNEELHRHSMPLDTSPVLASQEKPALLRRKALSSRGQHISRRAASVTHATAKKPSDNNNFTDKDNSNNNMSDDELTGLSSNGIQLYDQPTIINEWVDLGNVIETNSSQQFLHRMDAAENHILTQQTSAPKTATPSALSSTKKRNQLRRSVSYRLSWTPSDNKKGPSWIRGLFGKHRVVDDISLSSSPKPKPTTTFSSFSSQASSTAIPSSSSPTPSTPSPPITRSSSLNLISYLSRKLSRSSSPSTTSKSEKLVNGHSRRRYSSFFVHGRNSSKKHQVTPMEIDCTEDDKRLPLHMERGIYRLSHMKLTNPRRPLREQVIISNFMFWYLSIINVPPHKIQQQQQQLNHDVNSTSHHQYTNNNSASLLSSSCGPEPENIQLEKPSSPISHPVHVPLKRPSTETGKDLKDIVNTIPAARPASPLALKDKKDKYKPIKNSYFGKQIPNHAPSYSSL
ncbi:unnamed protein product [Absidia cylindrospora]